MRLGMIASSSQHPTRQTILIAALIGAVAAVASLTSIAVVPGPAGILGAVLALLMTAIAAVDARHFMIPNYLNAASFGAALLNAALQAPPGAITDAILSATLRGTVLAAIFLAVRELYWRLRDREGLGLGDVKLAGVAGCWLDWMIIPVAVQTAVLAALSTYLLRSVMKGKPIRATGRLPFGLFLAPAIWLCWLLEMVLFGGF
jgi:leader peptidase (prepilin peptidase)/N-methyltransferase